jgi:hypothetical protein
MAEGRIKSTELSAIAAAIRSKNGSGTAYKPAEMAQAILDIPTGGSAVIESKNITANGTYTAPTGVDGYNPVMVNVPNSYAAGDEGKVVSNGTLVAQTARSAAITQNGTYDTTTNNEVTVNVSGGGGATILSGSSEPTSAIGSNGDIYLQCISALDANLPTGYTELPAIEGTGAQYIDTSISVVQSGLCVKAMVKITGINTTSTTSGDGIWGGSWATNGFFLTRYGASPGVLRWHTGGNYVDAPAKLDEWLDIETSKTAMIIDGTTYAITSGSDASGTLSLFYVGSHQIGVPGKLKMGRVKVTAGATLLGDFVPCKNSNNVIGVYDLVSETFLQNAGSGAFSAVTENGIVGAYLKTNGAWQNLIGSDINDVGGVS